VGATKWELKYVRGRCGLMLFGKRTSVYGRTCMNRHRACGFTVIIQVNECVFPPHARKLIGCCCRCPPPCSRMAPTCVTCGRVACASPTFAGHSVVLVLTVASCRGERHTPCRFCPLTWVAVRTVLLRFAKPDGQGRSRTPAGGTRTLPDSGKGS